MLELMDGSTVGMINAYGDFGLPDEAGALLLVQSGAPGQAGMSALESFDAIATAQGADEVFVSDDPADSEML
ncbi:FAD-binding oxidoreductase, partial [Micrococcus sp. SIMBA_144]